MTGVYSLESKYITSIVSLRKDFFEQRASRLTQVEVIYELFTENTLVKKRREVNLQLMNICEQRGSSDLQSYL